MGKLSELPTELILDIAKDLDRKWLRSLAQVSRHLRKVILPVVNYDLTLIGMHITQFLFYIIYNLNPEEALTVRKIALTWIETNDDVDQSKDISLRVLLSFQYALGFNGIDGTKDGVHFSAYWAALAETAEKRGCSSQFIDVLKNGSMCAQVILLLMLLPALETVHIRPGASTVTFSRYVTELSDKFDTDGSRYLQYLKEYRHGGAAGRANPNWENISYLYPMLTLPSLTKTTLYLIEGANSRETFSVSYTRDINTDVVSTPRLEHMMLRLDDIQLQMLSPLFTFSPLPAESQTIHNMTRREGSFSAVVLGSFLDHHSSSLVAIDVEFKDPTFIHNAHYDPTRIGTFAHFKKLKTLSIPINILLGNRVAHALDLTTLLPASLENLLIGKSRNSRHYENEWQPRDCFRVLSDALPKLATRCPGLKVMGSAAIHLNRGLRGLLEGQIQRAGYDFYIVYYPRNARTLL